MPHLAVVLIRLDATSSSVGLMPHLAVVLIMHDATSSC